MTLLNIYLPRERQILRPTRQAGRLYSRLRKRSHLQTHGHDKYQRTIGDVILPDGINLNQELVKDDWCWWYRKYARGDMVLEGLEAEAREARRGLWADPQPVPPWEWRKASQRYSVDASALLPRFSIWRDFCARLM